MGRPRVATARRSHAPQRAARAPRANTSHQMNTETVSSVISTLHFTGHNYLLLVADEDGGIAHSNLPPARVIALLHGVLAAMDQVRASDNPGSTIVPTISDTAPIYKQPDPNEYRAQ